uniref:Cadherin domain-containing protein n=1 Tax=Calidris pygmaea TaxID=425635 RepID=A0A8C3PGM6_9CHAR
MVVSWGVVLRVVVVEAAWSLVVGQVRYSVPEEAKAGTVVGRLAQDLGLEAVDGEGRRLRLVSPGRGVEVSGASGALVVSSRLDREELCGKSAPCALRLEVLVERPLRVFHVELEVTDINDNAPVFRVNEEAFSIAESSLPGSRFPLEGASDADVGANAQLSYTLSPSEYFTLDHQGSNDQSASLALILTKPLDRETVPVHRLVLTASDAGRPSLTGTMELVISVLDANDNAPHYVSVDAESGRVWALQPLDYEEVQVLQFEVRAVDAGDPPLSGNATVQVFVVDENDNAPALLPSSVGGGWGGSSSEVVAKIRAVDADSGYNAWLRYELWEPRGKGPFRVGLYSGEVTTSRALEEADGPRQRLVIVVRDHGEPSLSATATLSVSLVEGGEAAAAAAASGGSSSSSGLRPWSGSEGVSSSGASATNVWLVVAICAVSSVFLLAVVLYGASRWAPRAAVLSGAGPATLVCASEVGSWSYSQRQSRSLCVAEGAGKSDLMVFSPNFPPGCAALGETADIPDHALGIAKS